MTGINLLETWQAGKEVRVHDLGTADACSAHVWVPAGQLKTGTTLAHQPYYIRDFGMGATRTSSPGNQARQEHSLPVMQQGRLTEGGEPFGPSVLKTSA